MTAQRKDPANITAGGKPPPVRRRPRQPTKPAANGGAKFVSTQAGDAVTLQHTASARRAAQATTVARPDSRLKSDDVLSQASLTATEARAPESRRKRRVARTMRRFESAIARLPKPALRPRTNTGTNTGANTRANPGIRTVSNTGPQVKSVPGWVAWVAIIGTVLLGLAGALVYVHTDPGWFVYRDTVQINGLSYLDADQLYAASGVDSWHGLWLRAPMIRDRLLRQPLVQEATVVVTWPNRVTITVVEQQPVALWVTNEATWWLMPAGEALPVHDDRFNALPQIVDPLGEAQAVTSPGRLAMEKSVLDGALGLWANVAEMNQLRYNQDYGLNFNLPGALTWVYWGDGEEMERKFAHLAAVRQMIDQGEAKPQIIDVRFERPYFR